MEHINYSTLFFLVSLVFALSLLVFHFLLKRKTTLKKKNETGERFAIQSKPIIGGTVFFASVISAIICVFINGLLQYNTNESGIFTNGQLIEFIALAVCCILAFGMGYIDDVNNFSPLFKLIFQLICSAILITTDVHIATSDNIFLNYALTVFWVVGIMNSINMLDNMDGVTASTALIIFLGLFGIAFVEGFCSEQIILLFIIASLIAFLFGNWHPAKMYMGDNGSQLLGVLLAYFSIKFVWNSADDIKGFNYSQVIFIGMMFLVPLIDTTTVAVNRFLAGHSPFVGDRYHTTHCWVYKGLSIPQTVLLLDFITLVGSVATWYFITYYNARLTITMALIAFAYMTIVFLVAYIMNLIIRKENNLLNHKHE
ncbi:MAG: undecaprenyl/decaprenyl-phosphate alpha-N-acetylglucosaminyl 1-phosphate transferase [Bacteroidales bacterium]|nr:undecaprenyl/decaprenyl-phosphate alpha-N-acetylglucosaminyl 1-phosphate transferase [Bacteroidales bacterium]